MSVQARSVFVWEGPSLHAYGQQAGGDPPVPHKVFAAASRLQHTLGSRPTGPVTLQVDGWSLHGHAVHDYGSMVCAFPDADMAAAYRCYGRALGMLTDGRVQLVTPDRFPLPPHTDSVLVQGSVETVSEAHLLLSRFRSLLPELVPAKRVLPYELVFAELAANTLKYGKRGRITVSADAKALLVRSQDRGPGIPLPLLPSSLLVPGYSTTRGSLGVGYPTILRLAESLTIATGDHGTDILVRLTLTPSEVK